MTISLSWLRALLFATAAALALLVVTSAHGLSTARASTSSVIDLDDSNPVVDIWPSLRILDEPLEGLNAYQALAKRDEFMKPDAPRASLGGRKAPMWSTFEAHVESGLGRWVFDIDYTALSKIDVYVFEGDNIVAAAQLGAAIPYAQRPMPSRSHAVALDLQPGRTYTFMVRIETQSSMIVPMTLSTPSALQMRENMTLLTQGLMVGVALCMFVYSAIHGMALREPLFLLYAGMLIGCTSFFADFFGLPQMVFGYARSEKMALGSPIAILVALACGAEFVIRSLALNRHSPVTARCLRGLTLLGCLTIALALTDVITYRQTQFVTTAIGPFGPLLALPVAWKRARTGSRIGKWMVFGWTSYVLGAASTALMLRGLAPANMLTLHMFQIATAIEMLAWLSVLGIIVESTKARAVASELQAKKLQMLANVDHLTGTFNRSGLQEALACAAGRCTSTSKLGVLLGDLDGFKSVNDTYGHHAGDELLRQVAHRLQRSLRAGDIVGRLGGDEFVVLLCDVDDAEHARKIGQLLIDAISLPFVVEGKNCSIGLTLGLAISPDDATSPADLLRLADAAMYVGKRDGRRRLVVAGQSPLDVPPGAGEVTAALVGARFKSMPTIRPGSSTDLARAHCQAEAL